MYEYMMDYTGYEEEAEWAKGEWFEQYLLESGYYENIGGIQNV